MADNNGLGTISWTILPLPSWSKLLNPPTALKPPMGSIFSRPPGNRDLFWLVPPSVVARRRRCRRRRQKQGCGKCGSPPTRRASRETNNRVESEAADFYPYLSASLDHGAVNPHPTAKQGPLSHCCPLSAPTNSTPPGCPPATPTPFPPTLTPPPPPRSGPRRVTTRRTKPSPKRYRQR